MTARTLPAGEELAVRLALDNLALVEAHAPEYAKGLALVRSNLEAGRYQLALSCAEIVNDAMESRENPPSDDESIASRHLSALLTQARALVKGVKS